MSGRPMGDHPPNLELLETLRRRKVTTSHWDEDLKQTVREVRDAPVVPLEEDLMVILGDSWSPKRQETGSEIGRVVVNLLDVLATLVTMTSAMRSPQLSDGGRSADRPGPSFTPVWADKRLARAVIRLSAECEAVAGWLHSPSDPDARPDLCARCGGKTSRDWSYCASCGTKRKLERVEFEGKRPRNGDSPRGTDQPAKEADHDEDDVRALIADLEALRASGKVKRGGVVDE